MMIGTSHDRIDEVSSKGENAKDGALLTPISDSLNQSDDAVRDCKV